jgi:hypothetical protein
MHAPLHHDLETHYVEQMAIMTGKHGTIDDRNKGAKGK